MCLDNKISLWSGAGDEPAPYHMKTIELKIIDVEVDGKKQKLEYRSQLKEIMRTPVGQTASLDEVRKSLRVLEALEMAGAGSSVDIGSGGFCLLHLEDADFEYMVQKVNQARWPVINKFIIQFVEDVTHDNTC